MRYAGSGANNRQAIAHLREAVHIAPDYGQAWGALALAYRSAISDESSERVAGLDEQLQEAVGRPTGPILAIRMQQPPCFRAAPTSGGGQSGSPSTRHLFSAIPTISLDIMLLAAC